MVPSPTQLSVNVNKVATLRNSRGKNRPNVVQMAEDILKMGVHGITVHPRPDERHIRRQDVYDLHQMIENWNTRHPHVEFNIEGYPSTEYLALVDEIRPDQATLVPDPPDVLTSNAGWRLQESIAFLSPIVRNLQSQSIRVSLFVDPLSWKASEKTALEKIRPDRVELYTEAFADAFGRKNEPQICEYYRQTAHEIASMDIELNAGHDLDTQNLSLLLDTVPFLREVSIGHAIFCEALYEGLPTVIKKYLAILERKRI